MEMRFDKRRFFFVPVSHDPDIGIRSRAIEPLTKNRHPFPYGDRRHDPINQLENACAHGRLSSHRLYRNA
jgi:hypothetical protein